MRIAQLAVAMTVFLATPAMAWDCHIGVLGAGASGSSQQTDTQLGFDLTGSFDVTGGMYGGAAGCAWSAWGGWIGVEGDYMTSRAHGTVQELPPNQGFFAETNVKSLATLRAVIGMVYAAAGLGVAPIEARVCNPANFCATDSHRLEGVAAGFGAEYAVTQNLRLRAEYMYVGFEKKAFTPGAFLQRDVDLALQMLRAGVNVHF